MKIHYVYRISNIKENKHYYGVRSAKIEPIKDLGIKYFSSSSNKKFIKDQKENPQNYKYKIIKMFNLRESAIRLEIKLHNKFNVSVNESFYNKSKQTSTGFDTAGVLTARKGKSFSQKHRDNLSKSHIGFSPTKETRKKLSETLTGTKHSEETKKKISKSNKGKHREPHSEETKKKISEKCKGIKLTEETKKKMSDSHKNRESLICPYCLKEGKGNVMYRYHFKNCKEIRND